LFGDMNIESIYKGVCGLIDRVIGRCGAGRLIWADRPMSVIPERVV